MTARTQGFVLALFGLSLLRLGTSDLLLRFVRPSARPWVLVAGAAVLALAVWSLIASARGSEEHTPDAHGHHAVSRWAWLVLLPVVGALVTGPPALGAFTANRQTTALTRPAEEHFAPLPAGRTVSLRVFDFGSRAVLGGGQTLVGRTVRLTGFVARSTPDGFVLARLVIVCCAADALPIEVRVHTPARPTTNAWVSVTGTYAGQDPAVPDRPTLRAARVTTVPTPSHPYD